MLVALCNHNLSPRQEQLMLMMLAAWGLSAGVAAVAHDAGDHNLCRRLMMLAAL